MISTVNLRALFGLVIVLVISLHFASGASAAERAGLAWSQAFAETAGCDNNGPSETAATPGCHTVHAFVGCIEVGVPKQADSCREPQASPELSGIEPVRDDRPPSEDTTA